MERKQLGKNKNPPGLDRTHPKAPNIKSFIHYQLSYEIDL
jgi:hypothetical protein